MTFRKSTVLLGLLALALLLLRTRYLIHPVCFLRFVSDWTQPLDILSADSEFVCYYLSTKGSLGNPTLEQILEGEFLLCELGVWGFYINATNYNFNNPLNFKQTLEYLPSGKICFKHSVLFLKLYSVKSPNCIGLSRVGKPEPRVERELTGTYNVLISY